MKDEVVWQASSRADQQRSHSTGGIAHGPACFNLESKYYLK